jgi:hypothetical protein
MSDAKKELVEKVTQLVGQRFGGDWARAFEHYSGASGTSGLIGRDEVMKLLEEADIGNRFTRGAWTSGIIEQLDQDADRRISWEEFRAIFERGASSS